MDREFKILNLETARFECTYGRGCDGVCCRNGRPMLYPKEIETIHAALPLILPIMRPAAARELAKGGMVSRRRRFGLPLARVVKGWCIFFNQGCVLHQAGAAEGDKYRYKPAVCSLFPLEDDEKGSWFVRQKGYRREKWDLFCLEANAERPPAALSLRDEMALARRLQEPNGLLHPDGSVES